MKWLKHQTDSRNDLDMQTILQEFGAVGYGIFWMCLELVASQGEDYQVKKSKNWLKHVSNLSKIDQEETEVILNKFAELGMINKKSLSRGNLHVPKMAKYADEYTHKKKKAGDFVPLEEKRTEENRKEKKRTDKKRDIPFLIKKIGNGIDQDNIVESLDVLGITELTDSQILVVEDWLKLFPSRDYKYHALKCKTWWKEKGKTWTRPISAFGNWLEKTKADEHVIKKKSDAYESEKQKARQVEAEKYTDLPPEKKAELDAKLLALKSKIIR